MNFQRLGGSPACAWKSSCIYGALLPVIPARTGAFLFSQFDPPAHVGLEAGQRNFRFLVVGEGGEKAWLRKNLQHGEFPGVLRGDALAEAFANMDVFAFPSRTDTFGLVLLEALASGVPVVVSPETGIRAGVRHGVTGFFAGESHSFAQSVLYLMTSEAVHREMSRAARDFAGSKTWRKV